jgi:membrane protease YdiL (CAAX protease family)
MSFTFVILAVILGDIWYLDPRLPRAFVGVPVGVVAGLGVWHAAKSGEWGFEWRALLPGLRAAAVVTIPAVMTILLAGASLGTLHDRRDFLGSLGRLTVWGGAQQWILQTVVLHEARHAISNRWGILLAATLFAAVHLPNPFLTALTFGGGIVWCAIYVRYPNIIALALSHGLATLAILYSFDEAITGRLRIGYSYLQLGR